MLRSESICGCILPFTFELTLKFFSNIWFARYFYCKEKFNWKILFSVLKNFRLFPNSVFVCVKAPHLTFENLSGILKYQKKTLTVNEPWNTEAKFSLVIEITSKFTHSGPIFFNDMRNVYESHLLKTRKKLEQKLIDFY